MFPHPARMPARVSNPPKSDPSPSTIQINVQRYSTQCERSALQRASTGAPVLGISSTPNCSLKSVADGAFALDRRPPPSFKWSHSICTFPQSTSDLERFALTNGLIRRTRSPTLTSGSPPPSYRTFSSRASSPPNVPSHNPPPYSRYAARPVPPRPLPPNQPPNRLPNRPPNRLPNQPPNRPPSQPSFQPSFQPSYQSSYQSSYQPSRPTSYHHTSVPFRAERSAKISCGQAACFVIALLLLEAVLIFRSDSLAKFTSLESTARRASWERSSLITEREKSERERAKMFRERKVWEKPLEDRVPQGASWEVVWPAWECRAYGKREYWGTLQNIPEGWSAIGACMNMPVEIKGVTVRRPDRCAFVEGSPDIHGYWMVDWDQTDCKPWFRDFRDAVSPSFNPFPIRTLRFGSHIPGMYKLQVRRPQNRSSDRGYTQAERTRLVADVREYPVNLERDHIHKPNAL